MLLSVFHPARRQVFRGTRGTPSAFGHSFGGAAEYAGLTANAGEPPVHLLLRLNTADPAVGVTLPAARWLPLLCAIRYGACDLGYRVVSDGAVEILHQGEPTAWPGFPDDGYPDRLPAAPVALAEWAYDPTDPGAALAYAGVFGLGHLSPEQYATLLRRVEADGLHELFGWETAEDYLQAGTSLPFTQGRPVDDCPDPGCVNHGREASLRTFAIFQEGDAGVRRLWGPNCGSLQIIYQICPACSAVRTSNQSD